MLKRNSLALMAAAAVASSSLAAHAAVITFSYEVSSDDVNWTPLTGSLTVAKGATEYIGVLADVTGNANPAATAGYTTKAQPANLGLASFGLGFTDSAPTIGVLDSSNTVVDNPPYSGVSSTGTNDGAGGVLSSTISGGFLAGTESVSTTSGVAALGYGGGTAAELFNTLQFNASSGNGTVTFTPIISGLNIVTNLTPGSAGVKPTYTQSAVGFTTVMPNLTIIVGQAGTTSTSSSAQPIISLLTTAPTSYASQLGSTIALTYTGPGGYVPGSTTFSASNKGYGVVTGFHTPDTEIYALDVLNASGGALTSAQISAVVSDINASESGVTASLVTGVYSKLFPGYDVLLTGTTPATTGTSYYLGIDFSATGDQDPATQGFTVGAIAAVPEPATMAGLVLGASGLLLGRRKNRAVAA